MPIESRAIYLKQPPQGTPSENDFEIKSEQLSDPNQGQVLVENIYMSVDPYMRGRMRFMKPGERLFGGAIGRIIGFLAGSGFFLRKSKSPMGS